MAIFGGPTLIPPDLYTSPATSSPTSDVDSPIRPADSDLILPLSSAFTIAASTRAAASGNKMVVFD